MSDFLTAAFVGSMLFIHGATQEPNPGPDDYMAAVILGVSVAAVFAVLRQGYFLLLRHRQAQSGKS